MSRTYISAGLCMAAIMLIAVPAHATVSWDKAFLLQGSGGITNPGVLVGFNPQPEPPAHLTQLDMGLRPNPVLTIPGQSAGTFFDVFLAINLPAVQLQLVPDAFPPDPISTLHLGAVGMAAAGGPATFFDVFLDFQSSSKGVMDGASAVSFNPQPEPPALFGPDSDFGLNFTFTSFSDVSVGLRVFDAAGNQLSFARVPEPATLTLLGIGLVGVAWGRRRRKA